VVATQPRSKFAPSIVNDYVALGASPRGVQSLLLASKVKALIAGRFAVAAEDIRAVAHDVLRHRVMVNFHGQADRVSSDKIIDAVLDALAAPAGR